MVLLAGGFCDISGNALETAAQSVGGGPFGAATVAIVHPTRIAEAIDLPTQEPSPDRWIQPVGLQAFLSGPAQNIEATGGVLVCDNQISTRLAEAGSDDQLVPVLVLSRGSVTCTDNQLSAQVPNGSIFAHAMVVGATVTATGNRVAETVESTQLSIAATAPFLTSGFDNHLTHCPVIFGCENHEADRYFAEGGNLNWFRLQSQRCEALAVQTQPTLRAFCTAIFGSQQTPSPIRGLSTLTRRNGQ
ncbi:hypothetical protein ACERZ8_09605 [Tateyamaria armeniaca]|uniref:Hedgehog/Intein (Hint) domain-containing protein n=1 Tax=Tateyamaria armeniaca TaxID=2518930 RepID=A0ABW8USK3_9RHOB